MIEDLRQYLLAEEKADADNLVRQNELLRDQISGMEAQISQVIFQGYELLSENDKIDKILSALRIPQQVLCKELQFLKEQGKHIRNLACYIQKYLAQERMEPRVLEEKIKYLKGLVEESEQNSYPLPQTLKMRRWNQKLIQSLQKRLCDLVSVFSTHIRIRFEDIVCYRDLLNQQICREFVKVLHKDIVTYDVPTFSYILMVPSQQVSEDGVVSIQREPVIFTCEKAQKHYNQIQQSIKKSEKLSLRIADLLKLQYKPLHDCIEAQLRRSQENIKAQIEYILPYLSLEKRKQIIETLCTKSEQESSLYDILVRLRIKGQDGEMMQSNIRQLVEKVKGQGGENRLDEVVVFLEICESQDKALNIGFYVCNQLVSRLEGEVDYKQIERLLTLREEMRFRIHHPI